MSLQESLEEMGLAPGEARVYISLCEKGSCTATQVSRATGMYASKVYESLAHLERKGLVSTVEHSSGKRFTAASPAALQILIDDEEQAIQERREAAKDAIAALARCARQSVRDDVTVYRGLKAVKTVYRTMLEQMGAGDVQIVLGAPVIGNERLEGFLLEWHEQRVSKGIECRYLYDSSARAYGRVREKMPRSSVRYLQTDAPMWIEVFKDVTMIGHIVGHDATVVLITSAAVADGYRQYFELLWTQASS